MIEAQQCPECGAAWTDGVTCEDHFHQMLFWENEYPEKTLPVHHLLVLSYYLQHPSLYSPDGLAHGMTLLTAFVEQGAEPAEMRRRQRDAVNSGNRAWNITSRSGARGAYTYPPTWTITAGDITAQGVDPYMDNVRRWARSILDALKTSGNLPAQPS
ncbi:MAG TPA: DUF5946 family protein [Aggregatilinea sp.]|jgi:hypothetical protein|uniref:DUF5946 family protein n=1 Tax=Aggregatilinea sp. TaxID=2806333 RepID=UPI002B64C07F|nr:DUF5946 family protein [Aggregatilinea sp.]HML23098.1 DUF5946 family protein [Aggregatilinea sp.]